VVEDTAVINFIFENGALGSMVLSDTAASAKSWELTTAENPGYPSYESEDCYHIAGTLGSIGIPTMKLKFYPKSVKPSWWTPFVEETVEVMKADPIDIQLNHFLEVIKGVQHPLVTVRDGYRNLLVIDAIRKSAKTKSLVELGF
jgi:predicted dehydrogenase